MFAIVVVVALAAILVADAITAHAIGVRVLPKRRGDRHAR